jgi:hypothetical protein
MTAPRAKGARDYLSRLAEPVFPGEQTLAARPRPMGWSREVLAPREEVVTWRETGSRQPPPEFLNRSGGEDGSTFSTGGSAVDAAVTRNAPARESTAGSVYETAKTEQTAAMPWQAGLNRSAESLSVLDHPRRALPVHKPYKSEGAEQTALEAQPSEGLPLPKVEAKVGDGNLPGDAAERSRQRAAAGETKRPRTVPVQTSLDELAEPSFSRKREPGSGGTQESGTRVRIGTVEVRTVVRQQTPAPAPLTAPQAVAASPARASTTGPLARGLGWRFGLVQG